MPSLSAKPSTGRTTSACTEVSERNWSKATTNRAASRAARPARGPGAPAPGRHRGAAAPRAPRGEPLEDPGGVAARAAGHGPAPGRFESGGCLFVVDGHPAGEQARGQPHVERAVDVGSPLHRQDPHLDRSAGGEPGGEGGHALGEAWVLGRRRSCRRWPPPGRRRGRLGRSARSPPPAASLRRTSGPSPGRYVDGVGGDVVQPGAAWVDHDEGGAEHGGGAAYPQVQHRQLLLEVAGPHQDRLRPFQVVDHRPVVEPDEQPGSIPSPSWASMCGVPTTVRRNLPQR